jgi:hypothetical protein
MSMGKTGLVFTALNLEGEQKIPFSRGGAFFHRPVNPENRGCAQGAEIAKGFYSPPQLNALRSFFEI